MLSLLLPLVPAVLFAAPPAVSMRPQVGHTTTVSSLRFSPDGQLLASSGGGLRLWDVKTGLEVGGASGLSALGFAPDGTQLYAIAPIPGDTKFSENRRRIVVWDLARAEAVREFQVVGSAAALSPDAKWLVTGISENSTPDVFLWDVRTGKQKRRFKGPSKRVSSVAVTADGSAVAAASDDGTVLVFDAVSGKQRFSHGLGGTSGAYSIAFSPDGSVLGAPSGSWLVLLDAVTGASLGNCTNARDTIFSVAFSPDGSTVATASQGGTLATCSAKTGAAGRLVVAHPHAAWSVAWAPDGATLATGSVDHSIRLWAATGGLVRSLSGTVKSISAIDLSADGRTLAAGNADDGAVRLWDVANGKLLRTLIPPVPDAAMRMNANGSLSVQQVLFSPDGRTLVVVSEGEGPVQVWDVASGTRRSDLWRPEFLERVGPARFTPDGAHVLLPRTRAGVRGLYLHALSGGPPQVVAEGPMVQVDALALAPQGTLVATGSLGSVVRLYDLATTKELRVLRGLEGGIFELAFSPDGKLLAGASWDRHVHVWDVATGKHLRKMKAGALVTEVAFDPSGTRLVSAGWEREVRVWDVKTGKPVSVLLGHADEVKGVAFSRDGRHLVTGSRDGTLRLWNVGSWESLVLASSHDGEWVAYADDGLFDASPGGGALVAMTDGRQGFSVDQLALKNNRPDLLLARLGLSTPGALEYYRHRALRRIQKAGLSEAELSGALTDLPTARIVAAPASAGQPSVEVTLEAEDRRGLKWLQLYANGTPLFEAPGRAIEGTRETVTVPVELVSGKTLLEVGATNLLGQESLRALVTLESATAAPRTLYFVGFGVSDYADEGIPDLAFAHRDALDLAEAMKGVAGFTAQHVLTRVNAEVTRGAIAEARAFLAKARPQDTVVLFIAGHGLHGDESGTYYFLTHDTRLADLAGTAASFEEVESLLEGPKARQKVFLMDTCESGERDEGAESMTLASAKGAGLSARSVARGFRRPGQPEGAPASAPRPWLLERDRYVFLDLSRRTGAMVFSSSQGAEFSYEDPAVGHGLFTSALLEALRGRAADADGNGEVDRVELARFVTESVARKSHDLQHPTIDRDNPQLALSLRLRASAAPPNPPSSTPAKPAPSKKRSRRDGKAAPAGPPAPAAP